YVDRAELAKAFRGPGARPYKGTAPALKVQDKYPDYAFMIQVDQNKDGKISSDEFEEWIKGYQQELRKIRADQRRVAQTEKKLATETNSEEKKQLAAELKAEKQSLEDLKKQAHFIDTYEKHLSRRRIR